MESRNPNFLKYSGYLLMTLLVLLASDIQAQPKATHILSDSSDRPQNQFDFWLGEWQLHWDDGGKGGNTITKILDGQVIVEHFDGKNSIALRGMSLSVYNNDKDVWQQTWVDNNGSYLTFTGGMRDGKMILRRSSIKAGKRILQRMVWYHIRPNTLDWNWERSTDSGQNWKVLWKIHYRRKAK